MTHSPAKIRDLEREAKNLAVVKRSILGWREESGGNDAWQLQKKDASLSIHNTQGASPSVVERRVEQSPPSNKSPEGGGRMTQKIVIGKRGPIPG